MIGSNVSTVGGIAKGFVQAVAWGAESIQIYTTPSRTWAVPKRSPEDIQNFRSAAKSCQDLIVVAHVPFLVNLASPNPNVYKKSVARLIIEIQSAEELGIDRIVLHPGSSVGGDREMGLNRIADGIQNVLLHTPDSKIMILLETMAGQGSQLGCNFEELATIIEQVNSNDRIGICFDTCHLYAAGYNIRGYDGFLNTMNEFDNILGINRLGAFHLNDSKTPLGSRVDRHCSIGHGLLGIEVFCAIVRDKRFSHLPMIVENPNRDRESQNDIYLLKYFRATQDYLPDPPLPQWASSCQLELY